MGASPPVAAKSAAANHASWPRVEKKRKIVDKQRTYFQVF